MKTPDLTQHPPRSPRVRLGGYVILPRMLDKCRALLAGKNGEYCYDCPTDAHFLEFVGIDAKALKAEIAKGKSDGEILAWIGAKAKHPRTASEIAAWSDFMNGRAPCDPEGREFYNDEHKRIAPNRDDLQTWFDLLDLDDYVTFGGKA
jgi:hypothetical protein